MIDPQQHVFIDIKYALVIEWNLYFLISDQNDQNDQIIDIYTRPSKSRLWGLHLYLILLFQMREFFISVSPLYLSQFFWVVIVCDESFISEDVLIGSEKAGGKVIVVALNAS
jgi:hypothetical protein